MPLGPLDRDGYEYKSRASLRSFSCIFTSTVVNATSSLLKSFLSISVYTTMHNAGDAPAAGEQQKLDIRVGISSSKVPAYLDSKLISRFVRCKRNPAHHISVHLPDALRRATRDLYSVLLDSLSIPVAQRKTNRSDACKT